MEIFLDTGIVEDVKKYAPLGFIDGVTTNPSLIAKSGRVREEVIKEMCEIIDGPISAEVIATDYEGMLKEADPLCQIHSNVTIKLPLTADGLRACKKLTDNEVKTNVTLCFSPMQALLAAKNGATFISPFIGRLDDISHDGMGLIEEIRTIYDNYGYQTKILGASIRHPIHMKQAALIGTDVATIPPKIIDQMLKHPLTDSGLEAFMADYQKSLKG